MKSPLIVQGMHGMGDCVHQRAVLRQLMQSREVWLETSWPAIYHDLVGPDLHLMRRPVGLRTQTKNAQRENSRFDGRDPPRGCERMRVRYMGPDVMQTESKTVLEAMCRNTLTDFAAADYRLPVPGQWLDELEKVFPEFRLGFDKPLLVYRPLVERTEWRGSSARNANPRCYIHLFAFLREHFTVVSVADLAPGKEWAVGPQLKADYTFHAGELNFEALAALFSVADLVFTSSGFAAVLAPAVRTPCISIVGGYEFPGTHDSGARFAPFLSIGPREPCLCWTSACNRRCEKDIDMSSAIKQMAEFVSQQYGLDILPRKGDPFEMFDLKPVTIGQPLAHPFYAALMRSQGLKA
jgi:hypothetical protein